MMGKKMVRLLTFATFVASLLIWSAHASANSPQMPGDAGAVTPGTVRGTGNAPVGQRLGSTNADAEGLAGMLGRFRNTAPLQPRSAAVPMPAGPPPTSLLEGILAPQHYQQLSSTVAGGGPPLGHPAMMEHGPPPMHPAMMMHGPPPMHPTMMMHGPPPGHPAMMHALPPGVSIQTNEHHGNIQERIVYIPYAMPPQIQVERLARIIPRPINIRRVLGDARMYEYPEMPMSLYTTRGPRDFLAPNPPGIGF